MRHPTLSSLRLDGDLKVELAQDPLQIPRDVPNATKFRAMRADADPEAAAPEAAASPPR